MSPDELEDDPLELVVPPEADGLRLDRALAELVPDRSRARIQKDLAADAVRLNGQPPARGAKTAVKAGDRIEYRPLPPEPLDVVPEDLPLTIVLYEDDHLVVIDKPAGMVVHPALGHPRGTVVNAVLHHLGRGPLQDDLRPGIVHRLDKDTTGLLVVAKHPEAHERMAALFKERAVEKIYLAVTKGVPKPPKGTIDTLFGRHPTDRKRFSSKVRDGKRAVTHYEVQASFQVAAHVRVRLDTGRTHQIRVHFSDLGHPLVGDEMYGRKKGEGVLAGFARPALHAHRLSFVHPFTGVELRLEAVVPEDLQALLRALAGA
ncbi:MAG: RluA family pseudouridine synthase [Myxococcales bacterium]|nr:RluA family pseudouridine synthase [Myxococcales bacterium]